MRNFREYEVWQDSVRFATLIYELTKQFPSYDGIINQIQRASVSIASNIAEGASRASSTDFARYVEIALGSAYEAETQLEIAHNVGFVGDDVYSQTIEQLFSIERRLTTLISTLRKKP